MLKPALPLPWGCLAQKQGFDCPHLLHCKPFSHSLLQEDGDQSLLSSRAGNDQAVRDLMGRVGETFHIHMQNEPNQDLIHALVKASLSDLKRIWEPKYISYRATPNHLPLVSVVVALAQRPHPPERFLPGLTEILTWLLDQGARVDARDIGGYTALGHAAAHHPVLSLAELLVRKGADVNSVNRFGCSVLHSAVMASEVHPGQLSCHLLQQPVVDSKLLSRCFSL